MQRSHKSSPAYVARIHACTSHFSKLNHRWQVPLGVKKPWEVHLVALLQLADAELVVFDYLRSVVEWNQHGCLQYRSLHWYRHLGLVGCLLDGRNSLRNLIKQMIIADEWRLLLILKFNSLLRAFKFHIVNQFFISNWFFDPVISVFFIIYLPFPDFLDLESISA